MWFRRKIFVTNVTVSVKIIVIVHKYRAIQIYYFQWAESFKTHVHNVNSNQTKVTQKHQCPPGIVYAGNPGDRVSGRAIASRYFELVKLIALINTVFEKSLNNGLNNSLTFSLSHFGCTQRKSQQYLETGHEHQASPRAPRHCFRNHRMGWRRYAITRESYEPVH